MILYIKKPVTDANTVFFAYSDYFDNIWHDFGKMQV